MISYRIRTDQIMLARTNILLKAITRYEKTENCILSLYPIISRWVPLKQHNPKRYTAKRAHTCALTQPLEGATSSPTSTATSTNVPRSGLPPFTPFDPLSDRASLGLRWRKWSGRFENLLQRIQVECLTVSVVAFFVTVH